MPHNNSRSGYERAAQRQVLFEAQRGVCGCGCRRKMRPLEHHSHRDYPTLDHVVPASAQGSHNIRNLIAKRRRCNEKRGCKPPTPHDLAMLETLAPIVEQLISLKGMGQRVRELKESRSCRIVSAAAEAEALHV